MRTEVSLTVDVEFSIGGAFTAPYSKRPIADPMVKCSVNGQEHGLGFLLDALERQHTKATFFVETLNTTYFGYDAMGEFAKRIAEAGHDVQVHIHPCWLFFRNQDWVDLLRKSKKPSDSSYNYSVAELSEMLELSIDIFHRWGLPRPVALRVGNLDIGPNVYAAMSKTGFRVGSNVGLSIYRPRDASLQLSGGQHWVDGILELPILNFKAGQFGRLSYRNLTIVGTSCAEMQWLLMAAHQKQVSPIIILTHPTEFVKRKDFSWASVRPNRIAQRRLIRALELLNQHDDKFLPVTIGGRIDHWATNPRSVEADLSVPPMLAAGRMINNKLNDMIWTY
jgi:hypothetical protein